MVVNIQDETQQLKAVVLGRAASSGVIDVSDAYDPKSLLYLKKGNYPKEENLIPQMNNFEKVLQKHGVQVYRPELLENCNQIFARDIGFVIEDFFICSNILPQRNKELNAISYITSTIAKDKIIALPEKIHCEGGDVLLWKDYIFIGTYRNADYPNYTTARTNEYTIDFLKELFPKKEVIAFDLCKSNTDPYQNILHLDCCFQPIGTDKALVFRDGFLNESDYGILTELFEADNLFNINREEAFDLQTNLFSINPKTIVSDPCFYRVNDWLQARGFDLELVNYQEVTKQGGLFRCSTLPLLRVN